MVPPSSPLPAGNDQVCRHWSKPPSALLGARLQVLAAAVGHAQRVQTANGRSVVDQKNPDRLAPAGFLGKGPTVDQATTLRRLKPPTASRPSPTSASEPGSGTAAAAEAMV